MKDSVEMMLEDGRKGIRNRDFATHDSYSLIAVFGESAADYNPGIRTAPFVLGFRLVGEGEKVGIIGDTDDAERVDRLVDMVLEGSE